MNYNSPSDLKSILHSKRAHIYYLEHCRLLVNGGRVEYLTEETKQTLYWNIPIANTTTVLLGTGTSITQAAMRELAKAGVMVGFCGGKGTPLFAGTESICEIAWIAPQSEYRPTQYLQAWATLFFDEARRLSAAKYFQNVRLAQIKEQWCGSRWQRIDGFKLDKTTLTNLVDRAIADLSLAETQEDILLKEAALTKSLYKIMANSVSYGPFSRSSRGLGTDPANSLLDQGNYLAYGLAATAAWVLGIPHGFSVLHGKTRRGGLVFDVADLIKDSTVLPTAFVSAMMGEGPSEFKKRLTELFQQTNALDLMIDTLKETTKSV